MEPTGIVFNVQKFSIHDGPGVRTTVFLKGCPLRCQWCANPESQLPGVQITYDEKKCLHCGTCVRVCPEGALSVIERRVRVDFRRCDGCLACTRECPGHALGHEGEPKSVGEIVGICMQDAAFYEESGGGVTISGGEGMSQPDFTEALAKALRSKGIHTAIETTGCVSAEVFRRLAPLFDLLLFDMKHYDALRHREGTGAGNERIVENMLWARRHGLAVLPRIPVIPGFNSSLEDAAGLAALLHRIGFRRVQLLPFHQMGERKYELLNRDYAMKGVKALHPEDLTDYQNVFLGAGLDCFF